MTPQHAQHEASAFRRERLREARTAYGLDFVELLPRAPSQRPILRLHFLGRRPRQFVLADFRITRGGAESSVAVAAVKRRRPRETAADGRRTAGYVDVLLSCWGGPGEYAIELVDPPDASQPQLDAAGGQPTIDPLFRRAEFRFVPPMGGEADCAPPRVRLPASPQEAIDYLAKDYAGFRRLLLDRLSTTLPEWREGSPADVLVALVEVLAYEADHLSYSQDAVGTEAYLHTCRLRQSLRRHARLVDYRVHEGCNARTWVQIELLDRDSVCWEGRDLFFVALRRAELAPGGGAITASQIDAWLQGDAADSIAVFEPLPGRIELRRSHNAIELYDWLGARPCLPAGATSATLCAAPAGPDGGGSPNGECVRLRAGDVLIFEELRSPVTGAASDADPAHRHAIRIRRVEEAQDPLESRPLIHVEWDDQDALPFTLWIRRSELSPAPLSIARGNVVLADHGFRVSETLGAVEGGSAAAEPHLPRPRAEIALRRGPLTCSAPFRRRASATASMRQDPRQALPQVALREAASRLTSCRLRAFDDGSEPFDQMRGDLRAAGPAAEEWRRVAPRSALAAESLWGAGDAAGEGRVSPEMNAWCLRVLGEELRRLAWLPRFDLLDSGPADRHFVVEIDDERQARLRFGDGGAGRPLGCGTRFDAEYRIGNGASGNVSAEAIAHIGFYRGQGAACRVRNPLPAAGGTEPESAEEIRQFAPHAIRFRQQRAITAEDYERLVMLEFASVLQRAKATLRWTGHEFEVSVALDALGRQPASPRLLRRVTRYLRRYRKIGHALRVRPARHVGLWLGLRVSLDEGALANEVDAALRELFSDRRLADGRPAYFHPDRLTFGDGVFVSSIIAAAAQVAGVRHASVERLARFGREDSTAPAEGVLRLAGDEIAQLANDPSRPELGRLELNFEGRR